MSKNLEEFDEKEKFLIEFRNLVRTHPLNWVLIAKEIHYTDPKEIRELYIDYLNKKCTPLLGEEVKRILGDLEFIKNPFFYPVLPKSVPEPEDDIPF